MKVKSVEYAGKADVYNMEVEDTHSFVIQGGVVSHNCADEIRYFCMNRPIAARGPVPEDTYGQTPMARFLDIPKENIVARRRPHQRITITEEETT